MTPRPARRFAVLSVALALPLALLAAAPASAATVGVSTWSDIKAAFLVDGDTVRLDADITSDASDSLAIEVDESIILDLNGFALTVTNPSSDNAAISVPPSSSLTINATNGGALTATGGGGGAGIGGGSNGDGGTTTINGGTITATGGYSAAGIGGGTGSGGGITTINGGTITATGGVYSAGIGGAYAGYGGLTTINGGTITATGGGGGAFGRGGAGIGGGGIPAGTTGLFQVNGTPDVGAAADGGNPFASPITNPTTPAGVGYSATTSTVGAGGKIELRFHYLITFTANGGSTAAAQVIDDGDTVTAPATPTREGFTFAGWTSEGSAYDFSSPVTEPLELTATWTAVLAATGADVTTPLGIATLLLAGGVTLLALRRRAAPHTT